MDPNTLTLVVICAVVTVLALICLLVMHIDHVSTVRTMKHAGPMAAKRRYEEAQRRNARTARHERLRLERDTASAMLTAATSARFPNERKVAAAVLALSQAEQRLAAVPRADESALRYLLSEAKDLEAGNWRLAGLAQRELSEQEWSQARRAAKRELAQQRAEKKARRKQKTTPVPTPTPTKAGEAAPAEPVLPPNPPMRPIELDLPPKGDVEDTLSRTR